MRVIVLLFVCVCAWVSLGCESYQYSTRTVTLTESVALGLESESQALTIKLNEAGEPLEYATDVRSVYCLDTECEVISVRLFWDPLGVYQRYEIPAGSNLTKDDHAVFKRADHRILHGLLADAQSQVKRVDPRELLEAERARRNGDPDRPYGWRNPEYRVDDTPPDADPDAVSTPTPVDLKSLVVPGAAYTSLTLWNWANGELPGHVRAITREQASVYQLLAWLDADDAHSVQFALDALTHRKIFDKSIRDAVLDRCLRDDGDWVRPAWAYLTQATPGQADRLGVYLKLLGGESGPRRVFVLERLAEEDEIPEAWVRSFAPLLADFDSYYEVHLFLNLLGEADVSDPSVAALIMKLLDHSDPFIARRAERFLQGLPQTPELEAALEAYRSSRSATE